MIVETATPLPEVLQQEWLLLSCQITAPQVAQAYAVGQVAP